MFIGVGMLGSPAAATEINLYDLAFYVDGNFYEAMQVGETPLSMSLPAGLNTSAFDRATGLGTLVWTTSTPGYHKFLSFFDHEIDEATNTFFNETGRTPGPTPLSTQRGQPWFWQIDEPGFAALPGDIYNEFKEGTYENENFSAVRGSDDVSMGSGLQFDLASNQMFTLRLVLGENAPVGVDWYLEQYDPDSNASVFLSASYEINQTGVVPVPGTLLLLGSGLAGLAALRLKLRK